MKVLVLRQPIGTVHGVSLKWYRPGQVYDLPGTLAAYLVTQDFAMVEMRSDDRRPNSVETERRRKSPPIRR
jgi:hypothetical protein